MIITTGHNIDGYEIVEYLDILIAEYSLGTSFAKVFKGVDYTIGTISKTHEGTFGSFSKIVLQGLKHQAENIGADGIISVSFQFIPVKDSYFEVFGIGTAVKIKKKTDMIANNESGNLKTETIIKQSELVQQHMEQKEEEAPVEYSGDCIQTLRYIVDNIEQFKNTREIKEYYLKVTKPEDIDESIVKVLDKRLSLERMYGSMKYDTKKDLEKIIGE